MRRVVPARELKELCAAVLATAKRADELFESRHEEDASK